MPQDDEYSIYQLISKKQRHIKSLAENNINTNKNNDNNFSFDLSRNEDIFTNLRGQMSPKSPKYDDKSNTAFDVINSDG
jgi:hypothetical protein